MIFVNKVIAAMRGKAQTSDQSDKCFTGENA